MRSDQQAKQDAYNEHTTRAVNELAEQPFEPTTFNVKVDQLTNQTETLRTYTNRLDSMIERLEGPSPKTAEDIPGMDASGYLAAFDQLVTINERLIDKMNVQLSYLEQHL